MSAVSAVEGTITLDDGRTVQFLLTPEGSSRWGAEVATLWEAVEPCDAMQEALTEGEHWKVTP